MRDGIRAGLGMLASMRGSARAGIWGKDTAHLDHHHAHGISCSNSASSHRSPGPGQEVGGELAAAPGRGEARAGAAGSVGTVN